MTQPPARNRSADPGVPEALPRSLIRLRDQLGVEVVDRLWIFPPAKHGRREQGLVAVSTFMDDEDRRVMVTAAYTAEHTGKGVSVNTSFTQEGEAPPERFPGVMAGVVRRAGAAEGQGEPREVEIGGSAEKFEDLLEEFDVDFLEAQQL
jgi:hypothetical protein